MDDEPPASGSGQVAYPSAEHAATPTHPPTCTLHTVDINSPKLISFGEKKREIIDFEGPGGTGELPALPEVILKPVSQRDLLCREADSAWLAPQPRLQRSLQRVHRHVIFGQALRSYAGENMQEWYGDRISN